jgi:hypothetical protein
MNSIYFMKIETHSYNSFSKKDFAIKCKEITVKKLRLKGNK